MMYNKIMYNYHTHVNTCPHASGTYIEYINEAIKKYNLRFKEEFGPGSVFPVGEDSIYFRISSHDYDWYRTIIDFLWDAFGDTNKMPSRIWIGHDAETNPPEVVLFDGTPNELFEKFDENSRFSY